MSITQGTWDTGAQIREHKLATSIINLHGTPDSVFDEICLEELQEFVVDRSVAKRDAWLAAREYTDLDPDTSTADSNDSSQRKKPGDKAASRGSLTGYIIARYGTQDPALDERDWELLQEWFGKGMPVGENIVR